MAHEDLSRQQVVRGSSDRAFGLVFAVAFLVLGLWPLLLRHPVRWWALGACAAVLAISLVRPSLLKQPNRLWTRLGVVLGHVVSPIALGLLFYGVIAPIGLLMRVVGKDPLRLRRDSTCASYWIARTPPGPPSDSMENQF
jgi:hypothetical protein